MCRRTPVVQNFGGQKGRNHSELPVSNEMGGQNGGTKTEFPVAQTNGGRKRYRIAAFK